MDGAIGFVFFVLLIGVAIAIHAMGGIPGLFARARASGAVAPLPPGPLTASGYKADTTSGRISRSASAGFSQESALSAIDAFYGNDLNALGVSIAECEGDLIPTASIQATGRAVAVRLRKDLPRGQSQLAVILEGSAAARLENEVPSALRATSFSRTLRDFTDAERASLRLAEILAVLGELTRLDLLRLKLSLVWNDGKCLVACGLPAFNTGDRVTELRNGLKDLVTAHAGDATASAERVQAAMRRSLANGGRQHDNSVLERYLFAGARWATPDDPNIRNLLENGPDSPSALILGSFEGGRGDLMYDLAQSLVTIAPPGAAKSQGQVIRNLLRYRSGAVVLDLKGEVFKETGQWRALVGDVQRFAPGEAERSATFNPLDWVRSDPAHVYDDAGRLTEQLVVTEPIHTGEDYWRKAGRALITTVVAHTAISAPPEQRNMFDVIEQLYLISNEAERERWGKALHATGNRQLMLQSKSLVNLPDEQREGVFEEARQQLDVWLSDDIWRVTQSSSIRSDALRAGGSLYLCVDDQDLERYATVIRTLVGVVMRDLMSKGVDRSAPIVTFFMDEVPRLGHFELVPKILDIGRGYRIRQWLFGQNLGQFEENYKNKDMLKSCAARCYMNPEEEDAQRLSKLLNDREGLLDGRRKPLAEPWELSGPDYAEKVVVFIIKNYPARLDKVLAFEDAECQENKRLGARAAQTEALSA